MKKSPTKPPFVTYVEDTPTPSKEPSVDDLLKSLVASGLSIAHGTDGQGDIFEAVSKAKSQLLALHLGCLPEKRKRNVFAYRDFNSAVDLMEQKLREMYDGS